MMVHVVGSRCNGLWFAPALKLILTVLMDMQVVDIVAKCSQGVAPDLSTVGDLVSLLCNEFYWRME